MASLGSMRTTIDLIQPTVIRDKAGFATTRDEITATVRAQVEVRYASSAWVNRAAYTNATALLRIRAIPGVQLTIDMELVTETGRWVIDSIEPIGRYIEILAHQDTPEGS